MSARSVNRSGLRSVLPVLIMLVKLQIPPASERKSGTAVSEFHVRFAVCQPAIRKVVLLLNSLLFCTRARATLPQANAIQHLISHIKENWAATATKLDRFLSVGGTRA
ncbi:MAG: hypothetical protein CMM76_14560 [Rhodospirillaceae bacterium]|nr:hypothetical protein [Rhodospirillaceae bacterium]